MDNNGGRRSKEQSTRIILVNIEVNHSTSVPVTVSDRRHGDVGFQFHVRMGPGAIWRASTMDYGAPRAVRTSFFVRLAPLFALVENQQCGRPLPINMRIDRSRFAMALALFWAGNTSSFVLPSPTHTTHRSALLAARESPWWSTNEMLNHRLLSKDEEYTLIEAHQRAMVLREQLDPLIASKQHEIRQRELEEEDEEEDDDESWSLYGIPRTNLDYEIALDHELQGRVVDMDDPLSSFRSLVDLPSLPELDLLSDDEIVSQFQLSKGELEQALLEGAQARETLLRCNFKLVVSIAKKWAKQGARGDQTLHSIYSGSWNRPSLDEAVQEGIFGLIRAADKFQPARNLRFSTYATIWVTSVVRRCFQAATTGSLRVPIKFHEVRQSYRRLVKEMLERDGEYPGRAVLAEELGITQERLEMILDRTRPLLSLDDYIAGQKGSAGKAGADVIGELPTIGSLIVDRDEMVAEDRIDLSLLRQNLENAMATELAPHERDVLRLRLGLDDGVSRTAGEVAKECGGLLSAKEVRATEKRAFKKLRSPHSLARYKLLSYLDLAGVDQATATLR